MNAVLVHTGYGLMLCVLTARDTLWLRGTLVLAQSLLALYARRLGVWSIATWNVVFVGEMSLVTGNPEPLTPWLSARPRSCGGPPRGCRR
jgi:hypothetical protein